jgi:cell division protease FtsH
MLPNADPVHKVSIISRGRAGGYTLKLPLEDRHLHSYKEFIDDIAVMMGGFAAEKTFFGDLTTGPGSDIKQATSLAKKIITEYGMNAKLGPRTYGEKEEMIFLGKEITEKTDYSDKTAESIDKEIEKLINNGLTTAMKILKENTSRVKRVVTALLEKETLEKDTFAALMNTK